MVWTGHLAGTTTITATPLGGGASVTFTVYVTVADGLYYIKNAASGLYLQDYTNSARTFAKKTGQTERLPQLWKITYISYGNYSIRPIQDLSRALYVLPSGSVGTDDAAISDSNIDSDAKWQIQHNQYGYAFKRGGLDSKTMTPISTSPNANVTSKNWSASPIAHWELEAAKGIFLRDDETHELCNTTNPYTIEIEDTVTLDDLGITIETYGSGFGSESWTPGNSEVATVNSDGDITTLERGNIDITVSASANGVTYSHYYTIIVRETVYVINLYDSTIVKDSLIYSYIEDAVEFLNTVYEDSLYLHFVMDGDPQQYENAAVDICSRGKNVDCHANYCAPNCEEHCKNVNRISKELYEIWEPNHVIVFWSNSPSNVFCEFENNQHTPTIALAQVPKIRNVNGEEFSPSVVQIYSINQYDTSITSENRGGELAVMCVLLAHEIAHTLGLEDQYYGSHEHDGPMQCIMERTDMQYVNSFHENISNFETAFCDDCIAKLEDIPKDAYQK